MIRNAVIAIAAALALARAAEAATVDTAPLHYGPHGIWCYALNNSDRQISGTLKFFDQAGVLKFEFDTVVPEYQVRGLGLPSSLAGTQGFCRFEGRFSRKAVKVTLCSEEGNLPCAQAVHSD